MKITNKELISTEETINLSVEKDGELYRFKAVIYESPKYKFVTEINYLDKYEKPLRNSEKRKIKEFIKSHILDGLTDKNDMVDSFRFALQSAIESAKSNLDRIGNVDEFLNDVK